MESAEALTIRSGLLYVANISCPKLEILPECKKVIDMLNDITIEEGSYLSTIVDDCRLLSQCLTDVSFSYVACSCNKVAHRLVGLVQSVRYSVPKIWIGIIHPNVAPLIVSESLF